MKHFKHTLTALGLTLAMAAGMAVAGCSAEDDLTGSPLTGGDGSVAESDEITIDFSVGQMMYGSISAPARISRAEGEGEGEGTGDTYGTTPDTSGSTETNPDVDEDGHPAHSAEAHETQVNHVYFIFFGKDNRFITYQRANVATGATKVTFPVPSSLTTDTPYSVLMVANADYYPPVGFTTFPTFLTATCQGKTITQVQNDLQIAVDHAMNKNTDQYLPMEGKLVDVDGSEIKFQYQVVNGRYVANGAILFRRQVARIDLNNFAADQLDIKWVKVCNYRNTTYICRDHYTGGMVQPGISDTDPTTQSAYIPVEEAAMDGDLLCQKVKASLYTLPNEVARPSQDDAQTTYLMICAVYDKDTEPTYYRFNLNRGSEKQYLEKNHIYTANIMGVKGTGAPTESAARLTDAPVLLATVETMWEDDAANSDADAAGNFLILSKTNLTFEGGDNDEGRGQTIRLTLSPAITGWTFEAVNNTGNSNEDFYVTPNQTENTLSFQPKYRNNSNFMKYGYFKVSARTPDGKLLSVMVNVQQLSVNDDVEMLTVNGQTGLLEPRISGTGTTLLYQVQTGSSIHGWTCEVDDADKSKWNTWATAGTSYTKAGGNKGFLELSIPANISGEDREITFVVKRENTDPATVPYVKIKIKQPKSKVLMSVFPYPQNGELVLEGFLDEPRQVNIGHKEERTNSFSTQQGVFVVLADPVKYEYQVETNFDGFRDLRLSANGAIPRTAVVEHRNPSNVNYVNNPGTGSPYYDAERKSPQTFKFNQNYQLLEHMANGEKFYLNVFRTGPGDPDIVGTVKITAIPRSGETGESQEISFDVRITTNCEIGDAVIEYSASSYYLLSDRNVGSIPRVNVATTPVSYRPAENYSTVPYMVIKGTSVEEDFDNKLFSGAYYTNLEMRNMGESPYYSWTNQEFLYPNLDVNKVTSPFYTEDDVNKWSVMNLDVANVIWKGLQWSKMRPYVVSHEKHKGKYVGCYFPIAGTTNNTNTEQLGYYWTERVNNADRQIYKSLSPNGSYYGAALNNNPSQSTYISNQSYFTVRCTRPLSTADLQTYREWLNTH